LCEFAAEGKVVSFFYSAVGAFPKRVVVLPRLIAERNNRFYCIAYRFDKERYITYSIDRIDSYEIQAEEDQNKYQKQIEALIPFDKDSWFKQIVGISNEDAEIMEIELLFTPWQAQYMRMYKFHPEEQVLFDDRNEDGMENGKGRCIRVTLKNTYELRAKILELGKGVEVLKPQKLRDQIQNMLLEILEKYKS